MSKTSRYIAESAPSIATAQSPRSTVVIPFNYRDAPHSLCSRSAGGRQNQAGPQPRQHPNRTNHLADNRTQRRGSRGTLEKQRRTSANAASTLDRHSSCGRLGRVRSFRDDVHAEERGITGGLDGCAGILTFAYTRRDDSLRTISADNKRRQCLDNETKIRLQQRKTRSDWIGSATRSLRSIARSTTGLLVFAAAARSQNSSRIVERTTSC